MTALLKYDAACRALAEARSIDEIREWADKAAAVKEYARRSKNRGLELDAIEIRMRARRRMGELLIELKKDGAIVGHRPKKAGEKASHDNEASDPPAEALTLESLGINYDESSRAQKLAEIDAADFERRLVACRSYAEDHPEKHTFDLLKPPPGAPNAAMAARHEPDDSLDFFPTPPWATRALLHHVLPRLGVGEPGDPLAGAKIWEPACGEGHISQVLRAYGADVYASDIHDYGEPYRIDGLIDFIGNDYPGKIKPGYFDWIITNPPFGGEDKALKFALRALEYAGVGYAMFVRSQWAVEGGKRYEALFRDRPPTLCAWFAERVIICKGRWDPDGTGMPTAYCWLVWLKDREPYAPFWIPPGCKESLTCADDRATFAAWSLEKPAETPAAKPAGDVTGVPSAEVGVTALEGAVALRPEPSEEIPPIYSELWALELIEGGGDISQWMSLEIFEEIKSEKLARGSVKLKLTKLGIARLEKLRVEAAKAAVPVDPRDEPLTDAERVSAALPVVEAEEPFETRPISKEDDLLAIPDFLRRPDAEAAE